MKSIIILLLLIAAVFFCLQPKWYLKNRKADVDSKTTGLLAGLGDSALSTRDVPVASVLLYGDDILGKGYNTVRRSASAGGHAEINAISDAMRKIGVDSFMKLNRNKLMLITTWEPCLMCKGAIAEYNIKHVVVMKPKSLSMLMGDWKKILKYEWNKQSATTDTLQHYLFKKHPLYNNQAE